MEPLIVIVLVGFFGAVCWGVLHPPAEYSIRYSRGTVEFRGKFPRSRRAVVEEFFQREFAGSRRITVAARKASQGGLRFVVGGSVTDGDRQRIRNFFQTLR
jgi:hypothetical protein